MPKMFVKLIVEMVLKDVPETADELKKCVIAEGLGVAVTRCVKNLVYLLAIDELTRDYLRE